MKRFLSMVSVWALLLAGLLQAQQHKGAGMMYNASSETTIKGTVESVDQGAQGMMMKMGMGMGTHLSVKTAEGQKQVMLGPSNFISSKGFTFSKGDEVEVTGSKVTMAGADYLIAREVVKGGKTLTLRDKTGRPEWSGGKAGRGGKAKQQ